MDIPIDHESFSGRGLVLRTGGFFKGPRIVIDGSEAPRKRLVFSLRDNSGDLRDIKLKVNGIDPIPKIEIGGVTIELARSLTWYEYAWMGLPILLVFAGGGLGALFGLSAVYSSARIFRGERSVFAKYALSGLVSMGAVILFTACAVILQRFWGQN
jgi:hypothetical protein